MWGMTFKPKTCGKTRKWLQLKIVKKLIMSVESSDQQEHALEGNIEVLLTLQYKEWIDLLTAWYGIMGEDK